MWVGGSEFVGVNFVLWVLVVGIEDKYGTDVDAYRWLEPNVQVLEE
jgi:hypothetical protein